MWWRWARAPLASALVALLALGACGSDDRELPVERWNVEDGGCGLAARMVQLPDRLPLPERPCELVLAARVELPERWQGRPLDLIVPGAPGQSRLRVAGVEIVADEDPGWRRRRVARWRVPEPATASPTGPLDLRLEVEHTWTQSGWFTARPRLVPAGTTPARVAVAQAINGPIAAGCFVALLMVSITWMVVYLFDRHRTAYLRFAIQVLAAAAYPAWSLGLSRWLGPHEMTVMTLCLVLALWVSLEFVHHFFELGRPSRAWSWAALVGAAAIVVGGLRPFGQDWQALATVAYLNAAVLGQLVLALRLLRRSDDPVSAALSSVGWFALAATCLPDGLCWIGLVNPLEGAYLANLGLLFYSISLAILMSRKFVVAMRATEALNAQLALRVEALERSEAEIQGLNDQLRRQIADRSAELQAALALAEAGDEPIELASGAIIEDRYRVVRQLGAGGMGVVYEVSRLSDGRALALKVAQERGGRRSLARLAREAQVAARVEHPNIVRVLDVGVARGFLFLVMELVDGEPLRAEILANLPEVERLLVLTQIAQGLAALHAAGVVHRDLKPSNVLLARKGGRLRAKISDFGISLDSSMLGAGSTPMLGADAAPTCEWGGPAGGGARAPSEPPRDEAPARHAPAIAPSGDPQPGGSPASELVVPRPAAPKPNSGPLALASEVDDDDTRPTASLQLSPVWGRLPTRSSASGPSDTSSSGSGGRSPGQLTHTGHLPGTPAYMAPELAHGRAHIGAAADVFAFGVLAYNGLAGRPPFPRPPFLDAMVGQPAAPAWPLGRVSPGLAPELAALVDRCLAFEPTLRPAAAELAAALAALAPRAAAR